MKTWRTYTRYKNLNVKAGDQVYHKDKELIISIKDDIIVTENHRYIINQIKSLNSYYIIEYHDLSEIHHKGVLKGIETCNFGIHNQSMIIGMFVESFGGCI